MAISKLMHMKETAGNPSRHLKRAIEYIMNPEKTNDQKYVKVNQALHVDEINSEQIYERMLYTKRIFGKEWGRQGYHFITIDSIKKTNHCQNFLSVFLSQFLNCTGYYLIRVAKKLLINSFFNIKIICPKSLKFITVCLLVIGDGTPLL